MDITTLSDAEVKALAYDQICLLNQAQSNLNILDGEIKKRVAAKAIVQSQPIEGE